MLRNYLIALFCLLGLAFSTTLAGPDVDNKTTGLKKQLKEDPYVKCGFLLLAKLSNLHELGLSAIYTKEDGFDAKVFQCIEIIANYIENFFRYDDLIPNKKLLRSDVKLFTGLKYRIFCNTYSKGERMLEAAVKDDVVKAKVALPVSHPNYRYQLWSIEHHESSCETCYKISSLTQDGGLRYLEAFAKDDYCRPRLGYSTSNQLWDIEKRGDRFLLSSPTTNHGRRYLEAFTFWSESTAPRALRSASDKYFTDQLWQFELAQRYQFSALIQDFVYDARVEDLMSVPSGGSVVWSLENHSYDTPITVSPNIRAQRENHNSWSFTESHERTFLRRIERNNNVVRVLANAIKLTSMVGRRSEVDDDERSVIEWTTNYTSVEETRREVIDITEVSLAAQITLQPRTKATYNVIWEEVNERIPYNATVKLSGLADRSRKSGAIEPMAQVDEDAARYFLEESGFNGQIIGVEGNYILAQIQGFIEVKGAVRGKLVFDSTAI